MVVYILDDDESVCKSLSRLMRASGMEARPFSSADAFLEAVQPTPDACILLDITMPRVSGLQVQQRLREKGVSLPVIAFSARDDNETRAMAKDLDVQFFFRKPVDDRALLDAIGWVTAPKCQSS